MGYVERLKREINYPLDFARNCLEVMFLEKFPEKIEAASKPKYGRVCESYCNMNVGMSRLGAAVLAAWAIYNLFNYLK